MFWVGQTFLVCQEERDHGRQECLPHSPHVVAGALHLAELHSPIPCDVYLWCRRLACYRVAAGETPAPQVHSYTGQPVVEIHTIGSPPLLQMVLRAVCAAGARLAGPGEFTLRAFLAGRIDLTQAEAVLGVIDAESPAALDAALGQLAGGLARPLHRLRDDLLDLSAHVEAGFDFADEDLPFVTREELDRRLADAENQVAAVERQMDARVETVDAVQAVLVGRPNTGKSSLFNALVGSSAALVSHQPGTTRDYLTAELDFDGVKCRLIDTAGTEEPLAVSHVETTIEHAAQAAADMQRRSAHIQVLCLDSTRPLDDWERCELQKEFADVSGDVTRSESSVPLLRRSSAECDPLPGTACEQAVAHDGIVVLTKCDAPRAIDVALPAIETSSRTGQGVEALRVSCGESPLPRPKHMATWWQRLPPDAASRSVLPRSVCGKRKASPPWAKRNWRPPKSA